MNIEIEQNTFNRIRSLLLDIQMMSAIINRDSKADEKAIFTANMLDNASREVIAEVFPEAVNDKNPQLYNCKKSEAKSIEDFFNSKSIEFGSFDVGNRTIFQVEATLRQWNDFEIFTRIK